MEQYCRDEAINYKWLVKAQIEYGIPDKSPNVKPTKRDKAKTPDLIQLHYEAEHPGDRDAAEAPAEACEESPSKAQATPSSADGIWRVLSLTVKTPSGYEIEINTDNPTAVSELLSKLSA